MCTTARGSHSVAPSNRYYHFDRARVIVALDADFLGSLPGYVRYARDFASTRRPERGPMSRLYAAECMPSCTGACADHRLPVASSKIEALAEEIWRAVRDTGCPTAVAVAAAPAAGSSRRPAVAHSSQARPSHRACMHFRLSTQSASRELRAHGAISSSPSVVEHPRESLAAWCEEMSARRVETLLVFDCNPVYTSPGDLEFSQACKPCQSFALRTVRR